MNYKNVGHTNLKVSEIAFGGVEIGMPYGLGAHEMPSAKTAIQLLQKSVAAGINFYDTARHYGDSERLMGLAFEGCRKELVIATKCVHFKQPDGTIPSFAQLDRIVRTSLERSLHNLQTDYIDLYMLHYADLDILENEAVARIFMALKAEGTVKNIGVSVYKVEETAKAIDVGCWDAIQLPFNAMDQSHGRCFADAENKGIGIIIRSVLMRGILTERRFSMQQELRRVAEHVELLRTVAEKYYDDFAAFATKFALKHPQVSSVLVGIDKEEFLTATLKNISAADFPAELLLKIQQLQYPDPGFLNLADWDKKGWL